MKKYKWIASSDDGGFEDESRQEFTSKRECYNDMRNAALEKMKWNTQYDCDFADIVDDGYIGYEVRFGRNKIIHASYSGVYTYEIKEAQEMKTIELAEEQVKMIVESINQICRDMEMYLLEINKPSYDKIPDTVDVKEYLVNKRVKYQTLLNYIEQV